MKKIEFEVGDKVFDKVHDQEGEIVYMLIPSRNENNIVVRHLRDNSDYLSFRKGKDLYKLCNCCGHGVCCKD